MRLYDNGGRADYNYPDMNNITMDNYEKLSSTINIEDIPLKCPYELVNGQIAYDLCENFFKLARHPNLFSDDVKRTINLMVLREFFVVTDDAAWKDWHKHPIYQERCKFEIESLDDAFEHASALWFILHGCYVLDDPDMEVLLRIQKQLHDTHRMCRVNRTLDNENVLIKIMVEECGRVDDILDEAWEKQKRSDSDTWLDWSSRTLQEMQEYIDTQPYPPHGQDQGP